MEEDPLPAWVAAGFKIGASVTAVGLSKTELNGEVGVARGSKGDRVQVQFPFLEDIKLIKAANLKVRSSVDWVTSEQFDERLQECPASAGPSPTTAGSARLSSAISGGHS
eukprot:4775005-Pyramimonas_sp.AAC.1